MGALRSLYCALFKVILLKWHLKNGKYEWIRALNPDWSIVIVKKCEKIKMLILPARETILPLLLPGLLPAPVVVVVLLVDTRGGELCDFDLSSDITMVSAKRVADTSRSFIGSCAS